jgi:hypothetical protein
VVAAELAVIREEPDWEIVISNFGITELGRFS